MAQNFLADNCKSDKNNDLGTSGKQSMVVEFSSHNITLPRGVLSPWPIIPKNRVIQWSNCNISGDIRMQHKGNDKMKCIGYSEDFLKKGLHKH